MGIISVTYKTIFNYPPEITHDFVINPTNWGRTYGGSAGVPTEEKLSLPLKVGDIWMKKVALAKNTYHPKWVLEIADRGRKFAFRQVNNIAAGVDGRGGVPGYCRIAYTFMKAGCGLTLSTRNLTYELEKGVEVPDDLMLALSRPSGIDKYHAAVKRILDVEMAEHRILDSSQS
jgi:hypothetical protein